MQCRGERAQGPRAGARLCRCGSDRAQGPRAGARLCRCGSDRSDPSGCVLSTSRSTASRIAPGECFVALRQSEIAGTVLLKPRESAGELGRRRFRLGASTCWGSIRSKRARVVGEESGERLAVADQKGDRRGRGRIAPEAGAELDGSAAGALLRAQPAPETLGLVGGNVSPRRSPGFASSGGRGGPLRAGSCRWNAFRWAGGRARARRGCGRGARRRVRRWDPAGRARRGRPSRGIQPRAAEVEPTP